jgi:hypothetical protein
MPSFTLPTICWMYYYRLQINWVFQKKIVWPNLNTLTGVAMVTESLFLVRKTNKHCLQYLGNKCSTNNKKTKDKLHSSLHILHLVGTSNSGKPQSRHTLVLHRVASVSLAPLQIYEPRSINPSKIFLSAPDLTPRHTWWRCKTCTLSNRTYVPWHRITSPDH